MFIKIMVIFFGGRPKPLWGHQHFLYAGKTQILIVDFKNYTQIKFAVVYILANKNVLS